MSRCPWAGSWCPPPPARAVQLVQLAPLAPIQSRLLALVPEPAAVEEQNRAPPSGAGSCRTLRRAILRGRASSVRSSPGAGDGGGGPVGGMRSGHRRRGGQVVHLEALDLGVDPRRRSAAMGTTTRVRSGWPAVESASRGSGRRDERGGHSVSSAIARSEAGTMASRARISKPIGPTGGSAGEQRQASRAPLRTATGSEVAG